MQQITHVFAGRNIIFAFIYLPARPSRVFKGRRRSDASERRRPLKTLEEHPEASSGQAVGLPQKAMDMLLRIL
ncbi:MAG: hypothetical protein R2788_23875 [Saprospiraceae bacterium]